MFKVSFHAYFGILVSYKTLYYLYIFVFLIVASVQFKKKKQKTSNFFIALLPEFNTIYYCSVVVLFQWYLSIKNQLNWKYSFFIGCTDVDIVHIKLCFISSQLFLINKLALMETYVVCPKIWKAKKLNLLDRYETKNSVQL